MILPPRSRHQDSFELFAQTGCLFVVSAVESVSDLVLEKLKKGHTREDVSQAINILKGSGIVMRPSLVPFTPWSQLDDFIELLDFVIEHDLIENIDPVQYTIRLLVPPGSSLLDHSDIREFLGPLDEEQFQYTWTHRDYRVDTLYQRIRSFVEEETNKGSHSHAIFYGISKIAYEEAKRTMPTVMQGLKQAPPSQPLPKLSESWFCCAEPTRQQFDQISNHAFH